MEMSVKSGIPFKGQNLILIKDKIFMGEYNGRQYVESLQAYRDIVIINSNEDITQSLLLMKMELEKFANNRWIGITNNIQDCHLNSLQLWVVLENVPIGKHWFQITSINCRYNEIIFKIKYIQPFQPPESSFKYTDLDFLLMKEISTYKNKCEKLKFIAIVTITIANFIIELSKFVIEKSIEMGYVTINFIIACTPICLKFIDFLTKSVYGFYWLIYALWRYYQNSSNTTHERNPNRQPILYLTDGETE